MQVKNYVLNQQLNHVYQLLVVGFFDKYLLLMVEMIVDFLEKLY